ncbi:MAG TPA: hypothetical protein VNI84_01005 [Pyrinomonadaceae bacterium]|nr:hypothetical protein [Pyrinomonadaceae bacterium]
MSKEIVLEEEILERVTYNAFSQKVTEEYDLDMSLTNAMMGYNQINDEATKKKLELVTLQRIELEEKWLRSKVKSTKARRDFESKNDRDFDMLEHLSPNFSKEVWEAEDELNRHLKKYGKE